MDVFTQYSDSIIKPGLKRIKIFLRKLGHPQNKFAAILVGGTNGKGSTVSFLYGMLEALGVKVGAYLSPHLFHLEERVMLRGECSESLKELVEEMGALSRRWEIDLSPFELLTASVFVLFNNCGIELAILEVGMGGRWDATNVVQPLASVIVSLGLDHTQYLGSSIREIALEKLPIARRGRPLVLGRIPLEGLRALREGNRAVGAEIHEWGLDFLALGNKGGFCYLGEELIPGVRLKLEGFHQWINASVALRVLEVLRFPINSRVVEALGETWLPGRMQVEMVQGVPVVFDVAHNPLAFKELVHCLRDRFPNRPLWALLKLLKDKPWRDALKVVSRGFERVVFLETPPQDERELPPSFLMEYAPGATAVSADGIPRVVEEARREGAVLVFTGSFRAVKEGLSWLNGKGWS